MSESVTVGLEVEAFGAPIQQGDFPSGEITHDAAPDLIEMVGLPGKLVEALSGMEELARAAGDGLVYAFQRPAEFAHSTGVWCEDDRYVALREALQQECPDGWQGITVMTNRAATHVNVGIDWQTPSGVALTSLLNNIGPYVSQRLQNRYGIPCDGQLSPWRGWATPKRLPHPDRWWNNHQELRTFYESIPRLIQPGDLTGPSVVPDLMLCSGRMEAKYHLGTIWHLVRPKITPQGTRYIEIRLLGSIDPRTRRFTEVVNELVMLAVAIADQSKSGCTKEDAPDLLADLRNSYGFTVPECLLSMVDWDSLPVWQSSQLRQAAE